MLGAARKTVQEVYGYGASLNNGDMVLVETSKVPGNEKWKHKVPDKIIFGVTMEPDEQTIHRVTRESVSITVEKILGSSNQLGVIEIAFPLIGTGAMGLSYEDFFAGFQEGVQRYKETNPDSKLKKIKIVIYNGDVPHLPENIISQLPQTQTERPALRSGKKQGLWQRLIRRGE